MPPQATAAFAGSWVDFMKAAGPYGVILGLLLAIWQLVGFVQSVLKEKDQLQKDHNAEMKEAQITHDGQLAVVSDARVEDMKKLLGTAGEKQEKIVEALTRFSTLVDEAIVARKRRDTGNGS